MTHDAAPTAPRVRRLTLALAGLAIVAAGSTAGGTIDHVGAQPPPDERPQTVLGPGLYVFQTRTRSASCDDDERTGYVSTFVAPIHGIPGARQMRMQLVNSPYWALWTIRVDENDHIIGHATLNGSDSPSAPTNDFDVQRDRHRFTGTGQRRYRSGGRDCVVEFDALLHRLDDL